MTRIIIHGCNGRMGHVLAAMAEADPEIVTVAGIDLHPDESAGSFPVYSSLRDCPEEADVVIDFSSPEALPGLIEGAVAQKTALLIATTGLGAEELSLIEHASRQIPLFRSANMSLGINLMQDLARTSAAVYGNSVDIEIVEKHHNLKADAPSGTALAIAEAVNEVFLGRKEFVYGRHGKKEKREGSHIGIHAVRAGTIVGEHDLIFAGRDEVLTISHTAYSKQIFAAGALAAAKYLTGKPPRFYSMQDMLNEKSAVTNLAVFDDAAIVTVTGIPDDPPEIAGIFREIADRNINIDTISQGAPIDGTVHVTFTMPEREADATAELLDEFRQRSPGVQYLITRDIVKISVEGVGMERQSGVAARVFELMAEKGIKIRTVTTSDTRITVVIDRTNRTAAFEAIRAGFSL